MHSQVHAETAQRNIGEVRSLVERRRDLIADLIAAGLNTADIEATFKALTAQLELFEQQLSNQRSPQSAALTLGACSKPARAV